MWHNQRYVLTLWISAQDLRLRSSWEIGTRAQALTEYNATEPGVTPTNCSFPLPITARDLGTPLQMAQSVVAQKPTNTCRCLMTVRLQIPHR